MKFYLSEEDTIPEHSSLVDTISSQDICVSQDTPISVVYNLIDLDATDYGFHQLFEADESLLYFRRMKEFSAQTINQIIDSDRRHYLHFYRTKVTGNIKSIFDSIDPKIAKNNPLIFHFALDPSCTAKADRETNIRNPRIYFMVGRLGQIHILFFDPYHEINPINL